MKEYKIELVRGVEGNSLYLNEHRFAGPKPWGGGTIIEHWFVTKEQLADAIEWAERK